MTEFRITKSQSGFLKKNIMILNCNHKYHKKCIKEWCNSSPFCPTCKKVIPNNNLWKDIRRTVSKFQKWYISNLSYKEFN